MIGEVLHRTAGINALSGSLSRLKKHVVIAVTADTDRMDSALRRRYLAHAHRVFILVFGVCWLALVAWGWSVRDQDYMSASSGLGYTLGLAGGCMILLLLTYSLRKRWPRLRNLFHLRYWFRIHMMLGVLAPTAILFHARFSLGSAVNSTVALVCLMTVAASGLIGRFLYNRVHAGVYGEKIKLGQVRRDFLTLHQALLDLAVTDKQKERAEKIFDALEELMVGQETATFRALIRNRRRARAIAKALRGLVKTLEDYHNEHPEAHEELRKTRADIHNCADIMLAILDKLPGLHLFERLFALWHVVHLPIFGLMAITVITHVIVVHMY